ncbi:molybdopterin molybdotransferase MoeA [Chitinimonas lacunae]|uniref:Molybdopterin molybdenumtransferase n=1 Tax=Chitinimonas lacunae TaxID=1963018 RepID=A0ABV8MLP5_9NEIS
MYSIEETLRVLDAQPLAEPAIEQVDLVDAVGRVAAVDLHARWSMPAFDTCAMDGYAIALDPARPLGPYRLTGMIAAGEASELTLSPGEAAQVLTGAPVPAGANGVAQQEKTRSDDETVLLNAPLCYGSHIRLQGSELAAGSLLLAQGERVRSLQIGLLASQGVTRLDVYRRPRVGVLSSGDELLPPGAPPQAGHIHDANRPQLLALLRQSGAQAVDLGQVEDDPTALRDRLVQAAGQCDIVIGSGGASVGERDHLRATVATLGAISHWQVAIKPGKPFAFGHIRGKPFFGLPGNPVAAALTFLLLARRFVARACGERVQPAPWQQLALAESVDNPTMRRLFIRGALVEQDGERLAQPLELQGSAALASLASADLLIEVPERSTLAAGTMVRCHFLNSWAIV